jgi:hypothetical protein
MDSKHTRPARTAPELRADQVEVTSPCTWIDLPEGAEYNLIAADGFTPEEIGSLGIRVVDADQLVEGYVDAISHSDHITELTLNNGSGAWTIAVEAEQLVRIGANRTTDLGPWRRRSPRHPHGRFTPEEIAERLDLVQYSTGNDQHVGHRVAIIGVRASTSYGDHIAGDLAAQFAQRGICVASTFGHGIDGAALRGALAAQGPTLGVSPITLGIAYPAGQEALHQRVLDEAIALSVFPEALTMSHTRARMTHAILAHVVDAVVVVEAYHHTTALVTVDEAVRLGKPVYAVPGPTTSAASEGTNELLRTHKARVISAADDLVLSTPTRSRH